MYNQEREMISEDQEILQPNEEPILALRKADDPKAMAKLAKEQAEYVRIMITHALDVTEPNHWVAMGGGDDPPVYPTEACAKRIARLFGINWANLRIEKQDREDARGAFYRYRVTATFTLKRSGDTIEEVGTSDSRKPFFAKRGGEWLPMEEVDEGNVEKAAITNCLTRGITGLVGVRGFTLSMLPERLRTGTHRVEFNEGSQRGAPKQSPEDAKKAKEIGRWLIEMEGGDVDAAMNELEARTTFTIKDKKTGEKREVKGKRKLELLTTKQIEFLHRELSKEIESFRANQSQAPEDPDEWENRRAKGEKE